MSQIYDWKQDRILKIKIMKLNPFVKTKTKTKTKRKENEVPKRCDGKGPFFYETK